MRMEATGGNACWWEEARSAREGVRGAGGRGVPTHVRVAVLSGAAAMALSRTAVVGAHHIVRGILLLSLSPGLCGPPSGRGEPRDVQTSACGSVVGDQGDGCQLPGCQWCQHSAGVGES